MIEYLASHQPTVHHWLMVSNLLFAIGLFGVLSRRNAIAVLMSVELMLNAGAFNFVIFNTFINPVAVDGQIMSIFIIAVAAAESVVGMAIFVALFRYRGTVDVNRMDTMKE